MINCETSTVSLALSSFLSISEDLSIETAISSKAQTAYDQQGAKGAGPHQIVPGLTLTRLSLASFFPVSAPLNESSRPKQLLSG